MPTVRWIRGEMGTTDEFVGHFNVDVTERASAPNNNNSN